MKSFVLVSILMLCVMGCLAETEVGSAKNETNEESWWQNTVSALSNPTMAAAIASVKTLAQLVHTDSSSSSEIKEFHDAKAALESVNSSAIFDNGILYINETQPIWDSCLSYMKRYATTDEFAELSDRIALAKRGLKWKAEKSFYYVRINFANNSGSYTTIALNFQSTTLDGEKCFAYSIGTLVVDQFSLMADFVVVREQTSYSNLIRSESTTSERIVYLPRGVQEVDIRQVVQICFPSFLSGMTASIAAPTSVPLVETKPKT